jgi:hypothetical protein
MTDLENALILAGYRKYPPNQLLREYSDALYQKKINTKNGEVAYFINAYHYKESSLNGVTLPENLDWNVSFTCNDDKIEFRVEHTTTDIKQAENLFDAVFIKLNCSTRG